MNTDEIVDAAAEWIGNQAAREASSLLPAKVIFHDVIKILNDMYFDKDGKPRHVDVDNEYWLVYDGS